MKVLEESAIPDVQCTFALGSFKNDQIGELEDTPGLSAGAWQMRPCRAAMSRPSRTGPAINPRSPEEADRRAIIGGLRLARRKRRTPPDQQHRHDGGAVGIARDGEDRRLLSRRMLVGAAGAS